MIKTELVGELTASWIDTTGKRIGGIDFDKFSITISLRGNPPLCSKYRILLKDVSNEFDKD